MVVLADIEHCLEAYTLEELIEMNDLTEADVLYHLVNYKLVELPERIPL